MSDRKVIISIVSLALTILVLLGNMVYKAGERHKTMVLIEESLSRIAVEIDVFGNVVVDFKQHSAVSEERLKTLEKAADDAQAEIKELREKL